MFSCGLILSLGLAGSHKGVAAERVQAVADAVRVTGKDATVLGSEDVTSAAP